MNDFYQITGFQSPCAEFQEKPLSLDERYLTNRPSLFVVELGTNQDKLSLKKGDRCLIDRSLHPRAQDLVLLVIEDHFELHYFSPQVEKRLKEGDNFLWGVVTTLIREFR